jgi:lipoprotein-anchoring transpeptidase ErfK/SrfK
VTNPTLRRWLPALLMAAVLLAVGAVALSRRDAPATAELAAGPGVPEVVPVQVAAEPEPQPAVALAPGTLPPAVTRPSRDNPPPLPADSGSGRRIVYANELQWVWIVDEDGGVLRSLPVSGRKYVPNPGSYKVFGQDERTQNMFFPEIKMDYMTRFAISPNGKNYIGFHAIPFKYGNPMQTEDQLGTFQSGGCIRMTRDDAIFIFNWADLGTKVVVLP